MNIHVTWPASGTQRRVRGGHQKVLKTKVLNQKFKFKPEFPVQHVALPEKFPKTSPLSVQAVN